MRNELKSKPGSASFLRGNWRSSAIALTITPGTNGFTTVLTSMVPRSYGHGMRVLLII